MESLLLAKVGRGEISERGFQLLFLSSVEIAAGLQVHYSLF